MTRSIRSTLFAAILASVLCVASLAQEGAPLVTWPQFRGPGASGVSAAAPTPATWDIKTGKNVLWKTDIPGMAHAAPIVWGDRVYVITAVGQGRAKLKVGIYGDIGAADDQGRHQWRLIALERKTGKVLFDKLGHEGVPRSKRHTKASHCNSTPATDGKRVVAIFGSEGLFCFDTAGKRLWKTDLGPMDSGYFRAPSAQWGFASSPVIHDGKVVVQCDVQKDSYLAVFDLADGKEVWRTKRDEVCTWGTPTIARVGGKAVILVNGWKHIGAYDFESGAPIWSLKGGGDIPAPTPIVAHGMAYLTSAHGKYRPIRAIRLGAKGDITPAKVSDTSADIKWVHARRGNYMQTPIVVGDRLYACHDTGVLTCFDAKTGAVQFRERIGVRRGGFTASPVSDGKHVYFTGETGNVVVLAPGPTLKVVANNELKDNCLATPAIADGTILFRTERQLIAIGGK